MDSTELLAEAYRPLLEFAGHVDENQGWCASLLPGWTVRELLFHLATDCQRALVALSTPAAAEPDTDDVSYWSGWKPGGEGAQAGLRGTRIIASVWSSVRGPADLYLETARAVLHAAEQSNPEAVVVTQGHRLSVDSLLRTLAVEAAVHHTDLEPVLPDPPAVPVLKEVRSVLDKLLDATAPESWPDVRYIRIGTGRQPLTKEEEEFLGPLADRLPLFG